MRRQTFAQIEYRGRLYSVSPGGLRIGRGSDNEIVLPGEQISRQHAIVWAQHGTIYIRDQGSVNGTWVNGQSITSSVPLYPGDEIKVGRESLSLREVSPYTSFSRPSLVQGPSTRSSQSSLPLVIGMAVTGVAFALMIAIGSLLQWGLTARLAASTPMRVVFPPIMTATPDSTTLAPTATASPPVQTVQPTLALSSDGMQRAIRSVVYIESPVDSSNGVISGSGSIVDPRGYILTNFHVVRDIRTAKAYNGRDLIYIAVGSDPNKPPDRIFRAEAVALDARVDLALLKINAVEDGSGLPANLGLSALVIGKPDSVQIGEEIRVIGFPGVGGDTVTTSRGIVSGFLDEGAWIKTDTEINPGNSGGAAVNLQGDLIGTPTRVVSDRTVAGKLGYIRPIKLARDILAKIQ